MKTTLNLAILALIALGCTTNSYADRLFYTSELIDQATVIGLWEPGNIGKKDDVSVLLQPSHMYKGEMLLLNNTSIDPRLQKAIDQTKTRGSILLIHIREGHADLVGDFAFIKSDEIAEKVMAHLLAQTELRAKWATLTIQQKIEHSEMIVSGTFESDSDFTMDRGQTLQVDARFRGISPKLVHFLPTSVTYHQGRYLCFVQRNFGTGPDYMLLDAIPIDRATRFLEVLKPLERQSSDGDENPAAPQP